MSEDKQRFGWTHGICDTCWLIREGRHRMPVRVREREVEQCCDCGQSTQSGIYIRDNPIDVRYPTPRHD